jgi:chemotaxis protein CheD
MTHIDPSLPEVYVQPGESHLVDSPSVMRTILGSCVGIAWYVPKYGLGALCHPMLPSVPARAGAEDSSANGQRYVDYAIHEMTAQLDSRGIPRSEVQVKLFGGADVLDVQPDSVRPTVGRQNAEAAERILREEGFKIEASRLGGIHGLHLRFNTGTGEVMIRLLPTTVHTQPISRSAQ